MDKWEVKLEAAGVVTLEKSGHRAMLEESSGYTRVRYRPLGSKGRWRKFLTDGNAKSVGANAQALCDAHANHLRSR